MGPVKPIFGQIDSGAAAEAMISMIEAIFDGWMFLIEIDDENVRSSLEQKHMRARQGDVSRPV